MLVAVLVAVLVDVLMAVFVGVLVVVLVEVFVTVLVAVLVEVAVRVAVLVDIAVDVAVGGKGFTRAQFWYSAWFSTLTLFSSVIPLLRGGVNSQLSEAVPLPIEQNVTRATLKAPVPPAPKVPEAKAIRPAALST